MTTAALLVALGTGTAVSAQPSPSPTPSAPTSPASPSPSVAPSAHTKADAVIKDAQGTPVGSLEVEDRGSGKSIVTVAVAGLPPGFHGFHVHSKGVCDPTAKDPATGSPFFSAGSHLDTSSHPNHRGDLPNLLVGKDGTGGASYLTDRFSVEQLLTGQGTAIVVHSKPDNMANIPDRYAAGGKAGPDADTLKSGDSGARLACGVITGQ
ncbi:superoxide dismutase family protein [Planotetraspora thailandica]